MLAAIAALAEFRKFKTRHEFMNTYALILAGGSGTRFWPLSRNSRPKQLINLFGEETLLQQAIHRLQSFVPAENILILTNPVQEEEVRKQAASLPAENIVAEPCRRDTAPAVAYGAGLIAARDPEAAMVIVPSDQLIRDVEGFKDLMQDAVKVALAQEALITIGIRPTWPCPSYGYVERGEQLETGLALSHPVYKVRRFREKPSVETAEGFLRQGGFSWNAGMFVWSVKTVYNQLKKHTPELAAFMDDLRESSNPVEAVRDLFPRLTPISIDFALMEKADNVLNFEATFDWDDVGSWISVAKYLENVEENNVNTVVSTLESSGNIVFSEGKGKRVALLGVDNLIVVDTEDALLVADKSKADDIKKIVEVLPPELL